ncbi:hypothetical protein Q6348_01305 [Isoptericola sp. b441]|uniref:Succinate dehydrogenase, cytochrome b556 subunit n=1 Tax=Actinotalea lenta TaxID=3064654 RepID=A0ABT9D666_9CELL|nr:MULTISPECIES: hypothetical protein [unclassified Isoptericola]MDO8105831.1 hypothetical protein [Isoptericola sp. b441]MDO8122536.1 hypothetical protein [Isoptericola sp. b490]
MSGDTRGVRGWWAHPAGTPTWAFLANRVAGLVLVAYLYLHLAVLSLLVRGPESWDGFLAVASHPAVLVVDVVLFAAVAWHAVNGIRVGLVGTGVAVRRQRAMLVAVLGASVLAVTMAAVALLTEG